MVADKPDAAAKPESRKQQQGLIDQVCLAKIAGYWPSSFSAFPN